jgi:hypothetical protein
MTRRVVSNAPLGRSVGRHRRASNNTDARRANTEAGFSLIEVVLALVVLAAMLASTTSLVVNAMHVSQASRLRQIATDIAADELDCAIASLNVVDASSFPTPCGEQATLLSEQGFSGQLDVPAIPTVTKANATFSIEQEVQPGNGACVAPSGGAPPELEVTDWVTWAGGVTSAAPDWWTNAALAPKYVQESTLVAVPASALNPSDGSILVKITDDALNGQGGVTVNLYSGGAPATGSPVTDPLTTGQSGCALFTNLAPGQQYTATASETRWIDSNNDLTSGVPAALAGTGMTGNVVADGTLTMPTSAPSTPRYYAQASDVTVNYTAPAPYSTPLASSLSQLPLSFYNSSGLVTNPDVAAAATASPGDPVFPFHSAPSYYVVAGSCGSDSAPNGYATDGVAVPTSGSLTPGGTSSATIVLTPITVVVANSGGQLAGATVTANASSPNGAQDPNCPSSGFVMPALGLGTTSPATQPSPSSTTTTMTSSSNPNVNGTVTFTATVAPVAPATGIPTGTVIFNVSGTNSAPQTLAGGVATYSVTGLTAGTVSDSAAYSGSSSFSASSALLSQTVGSTEDATTTVIGSSSNPTVSGTVTFTATVAPVSPALGTPTGTVTFVVGGTSSPAESVVNGVASYVVTGVTTTKTATATYSGDPNFSASTASSFMQTVSGTKGATTTVVSSSANPIISGSPVTFTATVSPNPPPARTGTPTGTVSFVVNSGAPVVEALSNGVATYTISTLTASTNTVTAQYSGDANFNTSTSTAFSQQVVVDDVLTSLPYGQFLMGASSGAQNSTNNVPVSPTATVVDVGSTGVTVNKCTGGTYSAGYYTGGACTAQPSGVINVSVQ